MTALDDRPRCDGTGPSIWPRETVSARGDRRAGNIEMSLGANAGFAVEGPRRYDTLTGFHEETVIRTTQRAIAKRVLERDKGVLSRAAT